MKKYILCLIAVLALGNIAHTSTEDWYVDKSTHFIVYYKKAPGSFVRQVIDRAEEYYNQIADDLGFRRFNFWLWDNRAKIYIYNDAGDYQAATGQPAWSSGCAMVAIKTIHTYPFARGFFDMLLPHEMGHIIFREFVGFDNPAITNWLDEGVASYQERHFRYSMANRLLKEAIKNGTFLGLEELSRFRLLLTQDRSLVTLFYSEAVSIVDYLIKEFGRDDFVLFCQNLRDKKDLRQAIASTYPFSNLKGLDEAWQEYLTK